MSLIERLRTATSGEFIPDGTNVMALLCDALASLEEDVYLMKIVPDDEEITYRDYSGDLLQRKIAAVSALREIEDLQSTVYKNHPTGPFLRDICGGPWTEDKGGSPARVPRCGICQVLLAYWALDSKMTR